MDTSELTDERAVMGRISAWSPARRLALARRILTELERELFPRPRRPTGEIARGLLATDQPPPTDEEVEQWLEEERMKKYG
jgi:hypothetical protein